MNAQANTDWATGLGEDELEELSEQAEVDAQSQVMPGVSTGALLDAMENPEKFAEIARADLYIQLARMRRIANASQLTPMQNLEYSKFLAKMGKVDSPDLSQYNPTAGLPMISITMSDGSQVQLGSTPKNPEREKDVTPTQEFSLSE